MNILYSIIIVNYKTPQLLLQCLRSVYSATTANTEIIVVDNNSKDNSEDIVRQNFPATKWLQMGYNSGFARANNAGIRIAKGKIILLLNSDTLNLNDAIHKCFYRLLNDQYIACGVQLLNDDRSPQISGNYFIKGGLNYLMNLPLIGKIIRDTGLLLGIKKTNLPQASNTVEVDWINGAFLMVKKSAIEKAGLMDEDFFLYSEETEWCSRLGRYGRMCIYGDLNVVHLEGKTSADTFSSVTKGYQCLSDKKGLQIMLSNFVRFRKQYGIFWYLFHLFANLFAIIISFIILLIKTILFIAAKEDWRMWYGYSGNVIKTIKYFFKILFNKNFFYKVL